MEDYNKKADITILKNKKIVGGVGVKFVMSNYLQNSNNYFENMQTANIRSAKIPYFQILIIFEKMPYFGKDGKIKKIDKITSHNIEKYINLSSDNSDYFLHTPNKTLIFIIKNSLNFNEIKSKDDFVDFFLNNNFSFLKSDLNLKFDNGVIYNQYEEFLEKIAYFIKSL